MSSDNQDTEAQADDDIRRRIKVQDDTPGNLEDDPPIQVSLNRPHITKHSRPRLESRRSSAMSIAQIDQVLSDHDMDEDTYGVSEVREGLFEAIFLKPLHLNVADLLERSKTTLPAQFDKSNPLAPKYFVSRQWHQLNSLFRRIATTREGIRLFKTFSAFFIAYCLCLSPGVRGWLGPYNYMMVISVILNHPARTLGGQIEGTVLTIVGTTIGIGWGIIGLLLSTSTLAASAGYGGILAMFLALFMLALACIRAFFIRFYQAVLCAGIAIMFTTLADTNSQSVIWNNLRSYAVSWLFGQVIALVVNVLIFPDAGSRALATALHQAFGTMQEALDLSDQPCGMRPRRRLADAFVNLSEAYRDMRINITVSRFRPDDVEQLRNKMQAVIRALLSLQTEPELLHESRSGQGCVVIVDRRDSDNVDEQSPPSSSNNHSVVQTASDDMIRNVVEPLRAPTKDLLDSLKEDLRVCDAVLMDLSGYRKYLGPSEVVSSDLAPVQIRTKIAIAAFDTVESTILHSNDTPVSSIHDANVVQLLVFARRARETIATVEALMDQVASMQRVPDWPHAYLPSYPIWKAIHRTNAQVRHDRGGVTAGYYQKTFVEIARLLDKIKSLDYKAISQIHHGQAQEEPQAEFNRSMTNSDASMAPVSKKRKLRYKIWTGLYRLQGFESRYAFKVCLVTSLLSVPSYLPQSNGWWDYYQVWWVVVVSWAVMHPQIGGNIQDLVTRSGVAILGATWSGIGYAAGGGSPYVMGVFSALYMAPMLYRYTISSHPRSGLVGCLSFTVTSLGLQTHGGGSSPTTFAVFNGLAFFIGTAVPIIVNWVLWPFVARRELRHALSSMLFFMSILYRNVVGSYVYFSDGKEPKPEDIQRSEILEGRLREGFVRIRQLLVLTRHEIRLRAPFDPLPYSGLADACERFFDHLITVRRSAIFYNPSYIRDDPLAAQQLLSYRRDAVAAILGNLYILAGALRSKRKVPLYMPSAAAARKKLLVKTAEVEEDMSKKAPPHDIKKHKEWSDVYSFSYSESLTGCVVQLEELEKYTKLIVGEQGFDDEFQDEDEDDDNPVQNGD
ncbi:acid phosphatase AphA [Metarhizium robertsii ARSEF 23]|uniref:Acid phosphatase AphA n=2 Tax=Metarhizium robertsii TaxID=568076 RepID=A0A0B2XA88_METRA|nr:acid phosphatase AphA [Metarhizium robertsii ARSEF 23]KHO11768.1 acid phosphatase AphA [Metarhizium robertsii ARSEF 23]